MEIIPPAGLGEKDRDAAVRIARVARMLDAQFTVPGTGIRLGIDGLIGIIPGIGDALGLILSGYIYSEALRAGVRKRTLAAMGINTLLDTAIGAIPVLGDIFDIAYKSNMRNARLILRDMEKRLPKD
ncbi:DUF4112 domain-containing protein [Pyruvatibacter mobilis]|uniref:DUF4112 domain-containing protein n=2 Tax=Pyruvatibacter mobilis TaxID=1712261 RepID=A0A845Q9Y2_9HYPH|nr:DUF4112 domain-containing protein [Pyruvatibacter mobilis]QJD76838.1 DUF4112 domain-containing protein [Pyruvatibacter mobilis]